MPTKIVLDAGHGGTDSGATGNDLKEKNITLALVLACRDYLINTFLDVEVILTRATDVFIELSERANIANRAGADVFLSMHINANPSAAANGFETYIYNKITKAATKEKAERLQYAIHKAVAPRIDIADRGMKEANFAVVRETNMSALLSENGFISNAADAEKMKNPLWIQNVAIGHAEGLATFLGLQRKPTPAPATKAPDLTDVAANSPYLDAILWAINSGVMSAINGQFGTHAPVTRAELAQILYKLSLNKQQ
jgi:N-acetylmuramoyl-L-alanine amidase